MKSWPVQGQSKAGWASVGTHKSKSKVSWQVYPRVHQKNQLVRLLMPFDVNFYAPTSKHLYIEASKQASEHFRCFDDDIEKCNDVKHSEKQGQFLHSFFFVCKECKKILHRNRMT